MFDRRLKIFLLIVFAMGAMIMARAAQIQVVQYDDLTARAKKLQTKPTFINTIRGRILDFKGKVLAEDVPCIDAMVDYRVIPTDPDEKYLRDLAGARLAARLGDEYTKAGRSKRDALAKPEILAIKRDLQSMWTTLAQCPGMDERKIQEVREDLSRRVESRARYIWFRNYEKAMESHGNRAPSAWYARWLLDDSKAPDLDDFKKVIGDELISYPIVHALDADTISMLGKNLAKFPGLSLQPSTHRFYPYHEVGCHWLGNLAPITREERENDPNFRDERLRYEYNDLVGRTGIESLAEPYLRGERGLIEREAGTNQISQNIPAEPGKDVHTTIDIELQEQVQNIFRRVVVHQHNKPDEIYEPLHGAAVVIDIPTGQVRAMASYPVFDPNLLGEQYAQLAVDNLNKPLLNRATMDTLEPGSTVKPMVGLWGMKEGVLGVNETIECTGYLMINGKKQSYGRCWVASKFEAQLRAVGLSPAHHPVPADDPHPTGFLTFSDALERSCNPFHETVAMRLGIDRLSEGFAAFGLGQPTGIGIPERIGRLPSSYAGDHDRAVAVAAAAGIGQGLVAASPLQMACAVATIARGGVWLRPTLIADKIPAGELHPAVTPTDRPDRIDLQIPPDAIAMAHEGMWKVVHERAGTGKAIDFNEVGVCGKTGTAQASQFLVPQLDADGQPVPRVDADGNPVLINGKPRFAMVPLKISTLTDPNPDAPWYLGSGGSGKDLAHAWYIGFAPRQNPKIAFCVLVEYGGSGGVTAAAVAHEVLAACVEHGYLTKEAR